jgi:hypothetical protein
MPDPPPIERAFLRESEDGSTVFFPWGLAHQGYRLTGQGAKRRASRAGSLLIASILAIGTWTAYSLQPLLDSEASNAGGFLEALATPAAALAIVLASYWVWASRFVERFPESDFRVSREERLREAAQLTDPWKVAWTGVAVCGVSALLIWLQPRAWWLGLLGIALGLSALWWSSLLERAIAESAPRATGRST